MYSIYQYAIHIRCTCIAHIYIYIHICVCISISIAIAIPTARGPDRLGRPCCRPACVLQTWK